MTISSASSAAAGLRTITYEGVRVTVPARWPVVDGAHAHEECGSAFDGQEERAFLGGSHQELPACPAPGLRTTATAADGVWMRPGGPHAPATGRTVLPSGTVAYLSADRRAAVLDVWFRHVQIQIGVGREPAVSKAILDSITSRPADVDTAVLGRCPAIRPGRLPMPTPERLTAPLTLEGGTHLEPEPPSVRPRVAAATVWAHLTHDFGFYSAFQSRRWTIVFGRYSAPTPAHVNRDGSETPLYRQVPTWLVRGVGVRTPYGPCASTVIAPVNANTGRGMGVETIG